MREGWEERKIKDFCLVTDFVANGSFASLRENVKYLSDPDYAVLVRLTDFTKKWEKDFVYVSKSSFQYLKKSSLRPNDLIMSNVGEPGIVFLVPDLQQPMTLGPNSILIRPQEKFSSSEYLYFYFLSKYGKKQINEISTGAAQKKFNKTSFREIEINLPSLHEQQRIVTILSEAFAAIDKAKANAEQNLKNAKELFESYLQCMVLNPTNTEKDTNGGWVKKTLKEISITFGRGKSKHRPRNDKKLYGGPYPFIQTGDIRSCNHYVTEYTQTYNEIGLAQSKLWPIGTICITIAANIAETGILTFDACFPDSVIGIVINEDIADRNYVEYLLQSFKARLQSLGKGSAQANINLRTFENELFPFPSVGEQKNIVQKLDDLSVETKKLEAIYQKKINDLEELKKSILQKAFSGELKTLEAVAV
jgi:type I restriction enzyme S subunit